MNITDDAFSSNRWCIPYKRTICFFIFLYQVCNPLFTVARQKIDNRNLNHCIATRLLTHCSTCHTYQHLRSKRRIIDAHVEFEQLVLCFSGNALTGQVYTVSISSSASTLGTSFTCVSSFTKYGSALMAAATLSNS